VKNNDRCAQTKIIAKLASMPGGASFLIRDQAKPVNEISNKDVQDGEGSTPPPPPSILLSEMKDFS